MVSNKLNGLALETLFFLLNELIWQFVELLMAILTVQKNLLNYEITRFNL